MNSELGVAIEGLYSAFAGYPLASFTNPCLCCHSIRDEEVLHSKPLRHLSAEDLRKYAGDALLVWGDVPDFKHFLPRIFELYFTVDRPWIEVDDPESLFGKFRRGEWRTWPATEQAAVEALLSAAWRAVLLNPPDNDDYITVETWLTVLAQAEDELRPYLDWWLQDESLEGCHALSALLISGALEADERNPWWDGREEQYRELLLWIHSVEVREKLTECIARWPELMEFGAALCVLEDPQPLPFPK